MAVMLVTASIWSAVSCQEGIETSTLEDTESMFTTQQPIDLVEKRAKQECPCLPRNLCPHEFGTYSKVNTNILNFS